MDQSVGAAAATCGLLCGHQSDTGARTSPGTFAGRGASANAQWTPDRESPPCGEANSRAGAATTTPAGNCGTIAARNVVVKVWKPVATAFSRPHYRFLDKLVKRGESDGDVRPPAARQACGAQGLITDETGPHLMQLARSPTLPSEARVGLATALQRVECLECAIRQSRGLFGKCYREVPNDDDSRWLYFVLRSCLYRLPEARAELVACLDALRHSGALSEANAARLDELQRNFERAQRFWHNIGLSWLGPGRPIALELPIRGRTRLSLQDRMVPGRVLGAHFTSGYPIDENAAVPRIACYPHLPGLALSGLSNAANETLFAAVHHSIIEAEDWRMEILRRLPPDLLAVVLKSVRESTHASRRPGEEPERWNETCLRHLDARLDYTKLSVHATSMDICSFMFAEAVKAALIAQPGIMREAELSNIAVLPLFSIAVVTPGDLQGWVVQHQTFPPGGTGQLQPVRPEMRVPYAGECSVAVKVRVRQFPLDVESPRSSHLYCVCRGNAERLLGPLNSPEPGGDMAARGKELRARLREQAAGLETLREDYSRLHKSRGRHHPATIAAQSEMLWHEQDVQRRRENLRTLKQAGRELKSLWIRHGHWPGGDRATAVGARLALIGHIMGETPLLSCASGWDFHRRIDARAKLLAAASACDNGRLPSIEMEETASWRNARRAFACQQP